MEGVVLGVVLECEGLSLVGSDVGELVGVGKVGVVVQSSLVVVKDDFDVLIDFICLEGMLNYLVFCCEYGKGMVIGIIGFDDVGKQVICDVVQDIVIVFVVNFSVGVNVLLKLLEKVVKVMGDYIDIEIIEVYYWYKVDVLLGIVLVMGEVIVGVLNKDFKDCVVYSCEGYIGECVLGIIGFVIVCVGDIVGEYMVMFVDIGECIEIIYKVFSCMIFVNGVVCLVLWLKGKKNGLFDMCDVLDLNSL